MTQIIDHGKWVPYQPDTLPPHAPPNALFARRESDGVDWYDYVRNPDSFTADGVKFTVMWHEAHAGWIVGAAVRDPTMYLDESSGDVWRWSEAAGWTAFKGTAG